MAEPTKTYAAGDEVKAADINTNFIEALNDYRDFTLGENITAPAPVYLKASDSKIYKASSSAENEAANSFVGFLMETGVTNDVKKVQVSGKVTGLSSLTAGSKIYLKDTAGTYGTTAGTVSKLLGIAVSTTALILRVAVEVELLTNKDTDIALSANSDVKYPSQKAVKTYIDNADATKYPISGGLGSRASATIDGAAHQVSTDCIIFADKPAGGGTNSLLLYIDSSSSPTTLVGEVGNTNQGGSICAAINKNHYYKFVNQGSGAAAYIVPIGT